jgi:hypothetical protein
MFSRSLLSSPIDSKLFYLPIIIILLVIEWLQRNKMHVLQIQNIRYVTVRWGIYVLLFTVVLIYISSGDPANKGFIYVKFLTVGIYEKVFTQNSAFQLSHYRLVYYPAAVFAQ